MKEIQVEVSDYILTPLSCSSLFNELFKCLIYQKCQIPYPYNWLKSTINRRRKLEKEKVEADTKNRGNTNFTVENHFRTASKLHDHVEVVMNELSRELKKNIVREIIILFGPTPLCPKEVCTINIPTLAHGHYEESHIKDALKHQHKVLRQVFLSDIWMDSVDSGIACTNTYIFLKKCDVEDSHMDLFKLCKPLTFSQNVKQYCINLSWDSSKECSCCKHFKVLDEYSDSQVKQTKTESSEFRDEKVLWYQFEHSIQGFKNCYINKTAVCDLW